MKTEVPQSVISILNRPLPEEAIKPHPTKEYLSTINPIYVIERLNEAFGLSGWRTETREILPGAAPVVHVKLFVDEYGLVREAYGGNDNKDQGDAFKGAYTDAMTKIGSYLGIGAHVWKDDKRQSQPRQQERAATTRPPARNDEDKPWFNPFDKSGDITDLGREYAERFVCDEMSWKDVYDQFKVGKPTKEKFDAYIKENTDSLLPF